MQTSDFDYHLPTELIAQTPLEPRDSSRLLVLDRASGQISHRRFTDIIEYLRPGDVMVFNQSRVISARIRGRRADTGGKVEFLLLREVSPGAWQAMAQPGRRLRPGARVILEPPDRLSGNGGKSLHAPLCKGRVNGGLIAEVLASNDDGTKIVRLPADADLDRLGYVPLPPYIHQRLKDSERYQTVYAKDLGSAAAPTAGLHFTEDLLERIRAIGVETAFVTLHVGLDTFRPVQHEDPAQHQIHTEYYEISPDTAGILNQARAGGRRVIAVGTTSVRVLEQLAEDQHRLGQGQLEAQSGWAGLFILPGHKFRLVDAMITNFHLPRSTLLMLVSAFVESVSGRVSPSTGSGRAVLLAAYQEAIARNYRLFSFGDAMLIL
jgi:S-adenosylmethionine:tRNA ribosyltransferase-isomerase